MREKLSRQEILEIALHNSQMRESQLQIQMESLRLQILEHNLNDLLIEIPKNHNMNGLVDTKTMEIEGNRRR